jgi:hypothetical protein
MGKEREMSQITPDAWIERSDYDQPPNPDDLCMVCEKRDCVCPSDTDQTLGLQEPVEPNERTETDGALPLEHLREYDGAAEHFARHGELPQCMGSPGAIDWIQSDPEAFEQRVREFQYGIAMEATHTKIRRQNQ